MSQSARQLLSQQLVDELKTALHERGSSFVCVSGFLYQIIISDAGPQGQLLLDLRHGQGALRQGMDSSAHCKIIIMDADLLKLAKGELSVINATCAGRLEVLGDASAVSALSDVFRILELRRSGSENAAPVRSDETTRQWRIATCVVLVLSCVLLVLLLAWPQNDDTSLGSAHLEWIANMPAPQQALIAHGSLSKLQQFLTKIFCEDSVESIHSRDIGLVAPLGTGGTLLSQVMHGLRSNASMDFEEILEQVPWLEAPSPATKVSPKLFRTRQLTHLPPQGRYVVLVRDPVKVMMAQYVELCNSTVTTYAGIAPTAIPLDIFAAGFFAWAGSPDSNQVWKYIRSWHLCCWHNPRVFWMAHEDVIQQPKTQILRLAEFMLPELPNLDLLSKVESQAERQFMLAHSEKFDSHTLFDRLPEVREAAKPGKPSWPKMQVEQDVKLDKSVERLLALRWAQIVRPATGFTSYSELRSAIQLRQTATSFESLQHQRGNLLLEFPVVFAVPALAIGSILVYMGPSRLLLAACLRWNSLRRKLFKREKHASHVV